MSVLNGFYRSIQFTYETESNNSLSFLYVLIIRNGQSVETTFIFIGTPLLQFSGNVAL